MRQDKHIVLESDIQDILNLKPRFLRNVMKIQSPNLRSVQNIIVLNQIQTMNISNLQFPPNDFLPNISPNFEPSLNKKKDNLMIILL